MNLKAGETAVAEPVAGAPAPTSWGAPEAKPAQVLAEDAELVSAVRAGSAEAFDRLIARYYASVYNLVYRMVGDSGEAADTVQEVFLKVFRGLGQFRARASLKTWIFRIALHQGSNRRRWWRRHRLRETSLEMPAQRQTSAEALTLADILTEQGSSPFEQAVSKEVRRAVDVALSELPEPYRTAVVLRDLEEFSYEEIAEVLRISVGTVKSRLARGRQALKGRLFALLQPAPTLSPVESGPVSPPSLYARREAVRQPAMSVR